ncbi:MAG: IS5 family transposase [Acidobacteriaceae bacterium]|nr:IS5 family transposase [Acidobacteriaceae bacterium]
MWTDENRKLYDRKGCRYPSDMTDFEWSLIEPLIPPGKRHGRHRSVNLREVFNAILYLLSTGCQWRALPKDFPPRSTVNEYFKLWEWDGTLERIHHELFVQVRELAGKKASPTAAIIDSQSVKAAEKGGAEIDEIGYDAGKKVKGIKRHIVVDTLGMILGAMIQPASTQDRDGALPVLAEVRRLFPFIKKIFADGGYQGAATACAVAALGQWELEIVKRSDTAKGFVVLPKRWIVERTFGWIGRCRRLSKHFENLSKNALAFLRLAMIRLMTRRIARLALQQ